MAGKLMIVAVLCAVWCAAEGMDVQRLTLTYDYYPAVTHEGVVRRYFCWWDGQKMLLGSRWTSIDCYKCECTSSKKTCERKSESGDGVPDGCMRIFDEDCDELIVRRDDLWHVCY